MSQTNPGVFITRTSGFLPNQPVSNEEMDVYLGIIHGKASRSKRIVLRNNGIKTRYYARTKNGQPTHSNAQLVSEAIRRLFPKDPEKLKNIELLCCGTSTPDQWMPSHAVMVHGLLPETNPMEVVSNSGVCCTGVQSMKYAWMALLTGQATNAVATGSERCSSVLQSAFFEEEMSKLEAMEKDPYISFDKEFLRWMLSDGAGAVYLEKEKNKTGISLRLDWMDGASFAHQQETCMYMAAEKLPDGTLKGYADYSQEDLAKNSVLSIKQDVKLLGEQIVGLGQEKLKEISLRRNFSPSSVDFFLPHLSSEFFRGKIEESLRLNGMGIDPAKWFTNLSSVGNVGAGSVFLMLDELFRSGRLKPGHTLLLMVPESARFSYMFAHLTVC